MTRFGLNGVGSFFLFSGSLRLIGGGLLAFLLLRQFLALLNALGVGSGGGRRYN